MPAVLPQFVSRRPDIKLHLSGGETRTFLEDGNLRLPSSHGKGPGRVRMGLGRCTVIMPPAIATRAAVMRPSSWALEHKRIKRHVCGVPGE